MSLYALSQDPAIQIDRLLTSVNRTYDRISMHGVRRNLLEAQAQAIGLPLDVVEFEENVTMAVYNERMRAKVADLHASGYSHAVFGDLFLEDLKAYRDSKLAEVGVEGVYPLWKRDTTELFHYFLASGFKAIVVCCNLDHLPESFCGRDLDLDFLQDLPAGVDPCGENGEFHTFCYDGPIFSNPLAVRRGERTLRTYPAPMLSDGERSPDYRFCFCDLELDASAIG